MKNSGLSGFLNIRKKRKMTSSDVVEAVRASIGANAGHAGTLDPGAEGVLVLGVGAARKLIPYLRGDKEYEAVMRLGQESDTLDLDGTLTVAREVTTEPGAIRACGETLIGEPLLPVPLYSAVHVAGRRLHEMARAGTPVAPPVRAMRVFDINIIEINVPQVRFLVTCAAGTYVRSIVAEWGRLLGCGALLERLVRTRSGPLTVEEAVDLETLDHLARAGRAAEALVPAAVVLGHLPEARCADPEADRLRNGQPVAAPAGSIPGMVRLTRDGGGLFGIGRVEPDADGTSVLRPERILPPGELVA